METKRIHPLKVIASVSVSLFAAFLLPWLLGNWIVSTGESASEKIVLDDFKMPIQGVFLGIFCVIFGIVQTYKGRNEQQIEVQNKLKPKTNRVLIGMGLILLVFSGIKFQEATQQMKYFQNPQNHLIEEVSEFKIERIDGSRRTSEKEYHISFREGQRIETNEAFYTYLQSRILPEEHIVDDIFYDIPAGHQLKVEFLLDDTGQIIKILDIHYS